jgi:transmembrane sensor
MKKPAPPKLNREILEEASDWFVDFRVGDVDAEARERFDQWLRRSPEHIRAYWEIARTYVTLPAPSPDKVNVAELIAYAHSDGNVVPFNPVTRADEPRAMATEVPRPPPPASRGGWPQPGRRRFLAAAALAFALTITGELLWQLKRYPSYSTDIGERRSLTLADGSTVDLNARSSIRIEFSSTERRVELLDGQALFQVAKDKQRPFIVASGEATVRAVGTQFDVYRKASGTTVTVVEGRVAVYSSAHVESASGSAEGPSLSATATAPHAHSQTHAVGSPKNASGSAPALPTAPPGLADPSGAGGVFLSAGEQVTVTPKTMVAPRRADLTAAIAWTQRKLIFDGSKLSEVAEEFNRYNRRQLVIEGDALPDFHVSGVYSSTDPASLVRFLREQPGVKVTESESEIRIEAQ